jgi:divalent metal cation (Fe/Co/Zn/Cd) transporter
VWVRRALWLAYATIVYNLLEGVVAIGFGISDESVALFGFGLDSLIEVASAGLVVWRFRGEHRLRPAADTGRERMATRGIGLLFLALAAVTCAGAAWKLWAHAAPDTALPGLIIAALSLSFMFYLWAAKRRAAIALDSATVRSDAACSLACIKLSTILLAGSLLYLAAPALWWADAAAAIALAAFIAHEGWETVRASLEPEFTGGCGCSH